MLTFLIIQRFWILENQIAARELPVNVDKPVLWYGTEFFFTLADTYLIFFQIVFGSAMLFFRDFEIHPENLSMIVFLWIFWKFISIGVSLLLFHLSRLLCNKYIFMNFLAFFRKTLEHVRI